MKTFKSFIHEEVEQIDELSVKKYSEVYKAASKKDGQKHIDAQRRAYMAVKRKAKETSERMYESSDKGLAAAHAKAKEISKREGVVQHIEKDPKTGQHTVSDWYDSDRTVATYNNGKLSEDVGQIDEERDYRFHISSGIRNLEDLKNNKKISVWHYKKLPSGRYSGVASGGDVMKGHEFINKIHKREYPDGSFAIHHEPSFAVSKSKFKAFQRAMKGESVEHIDEGSSASKYKVKSIGTDKNGDYYISPNTGKKVYKKVKVGAHETPSGKIKNEEVKQIDELSHDTLYSYRHKASRGLEAAKWAQEPKNAKIVAQSLAGTRKGPSKGVSDIRPNVPSVQRFYKHLEKTRKTGIERADKKLRGEEVEQIEEVAAWQRKEGKNPEGGLNRKGIESYRREHPGSKLSLAVTTKPSKLKKDSKAAKRRKSFCARMSGMKRRLTSAKTANDPNSRINKSLRKWNC